MSDTRTTSLYTALLAAQRAMGPVKKDASNPAFRTKYATLQSVLETVEGPLSDNGLVLLQRFDVGDTGPLLITEIVHAESGQSITSAVPVVSKDPTDPQKMGGAITYYRRYSLLALLGLAPEDDDGNSAAKPAPAPRQAQPTPAPAIMVTRSKEPPRPPFDAATFNKLIERCWTDVEDGKSAEDIRGYLNAARVRMTDEQKHIAREQMAAIETAIAERAAVGQP